MWDRKVLKARAKDAFKRNYWKAILVSLILTILVGGGSSVASTFSYSFSSGLVSGLTENDDDLDDRFSDSFEDSFEEEFNENFHIDEYSRGEQNRDGRVDFYEQSEDLATTAADVFGLVVFAIIFLIIVLIIAAIVLVLSIFIFNPLIVGCQRFFFKNIEKNAEVKEIAFGFDHNYKNVVKVMFFKELHTFLWSLLFIIPGIVKSYEYMMIPYLLGENPDMPKEVAFAESKRMMTGQKWNAFVLDLSFIGWRILSIFTCGILSVFFVDPYVHASHAALFDALRYRPQPSNFEQNTNFQNNQFQQNSNFQQNVENVQDVPTSENPTTDNTQE